MKSPLWIQIAATTFLVGLLVLHVLFPSQHIDTTTVTLLFLILVVWFLPHLRGVELPGGFKIDFRERIEKVEEALQESQVVRGQVGDGRAFIQLADSMSEWQDSIRVTLDSIRERAGHDNVLALVAIRLEIEKKLRELARGHLGKDEARKLPMFAIVRRLMSKGMLFDDNFAVAIRELQAIGNRAAHGLEPPPDVTKRALEAGALVLSLLDREIGKFTPAQD